VVLMTVQGFPMDTSLNHSESTGRMQTPVALPLPVLSMENLPD
jgi:hypothetical protein